MLVSQGYYSSRTDFIRAAVRNQMMRHEDALQATVKQKTMIVGILSVNRRTLETYYDEGKQMDYRVVGMMNVASDVTPELAAATIHSIQVYGSLRMDKEVRKAIEDRIL